MLRGPQTRAGKGRLPRRRHPVRCPVRPPLRPAGARTVIGGLLPLLPAADEAHRGREREEREQEGDPLRAQLRWHGGAGVRAEHSHGVAEQVHQAPHPRRSGAGGRVREDAALLRLRVRRDVHPHGQSARAHSEADVEELRVLHHQLPVPGGVRGQAARGHRAEELLRLRRRRSPRRHRLRRRRGAFQETIGPEDELLPGSHGADDVHQRSPQEQHAGAAGLLGRRLRRGT